jgi:predicted amidohydrolase
MSRREPGHDGRMADVEQTLQQTLQQAVQAAETYAEAVRATARFVTGLDDLPEADALAEYAHLLGQEESLREARTAALNEAGLTVPSLEPDPE